MKVTVYKKVEASDIKAAKAIVKQHTPCKFRVRNFGMKFRLVFDEKPTLKVYNEAMTWLFNLGYAQIGVKSIKEVEANTFNNRETVLYKFV